MSDVTSRPFDLTGKVVLLTGATRGLAYEMARLLARAGAHVVINGRDAARTENTVARIRDEGGAASAAVFDVTELDRAADAIAAVAAEHGRLDGFVNNVGARNRQGLLDLSLAEIRDVLEANLIGAMWLARAAAQAMIPRGTGRIVNVTSIAARAAIVPDAAYIASKGGLESLTHALASELGPYGITVNAISPGFFATETNQANVNNPDIGPRLSGRTALKRWGQPHEIAGAAVFLCSDEASFVTGHTLVVDGGTTVTVL
jgi:gluconate 5-dehydrogenase